MSPYPAIGTFLSRIHDAGAAADWGSLDYTATTPAGTAVGLEVRTGDTATPDGSWSAFTAVADGADIAGASRYIQYLAALSTSDPAVSPTLADVTITYTSAPPPTTHTSERHGHRQRGRAAARDLRARLRQHRLVGRLHRGRHAGGAYSLALAPGTYKLYIQPVAAGYPDLATAGPTSPAPLRSTSPAPTRPSTSLAWSATHDPERHGHRQPGRALPGTFVHVFDEHRLVRRLHHVAGTAGRTAWPSPGHLQAVHPAGRGGLPQQPGTAGPTSPAPLRST